MSKAQRKKDKKRATGKAVRKNSGPEPSRRDRKGPKGKNIHAAISLESHTMNETALTAVNPQTPAESQPADPGSSPFKIVVDPVMRARLREALIGLIENHDLELARHFSEDRLALDSYKEYIEIFAHSLKQTMESPEGVNYLLKSCGFNVKESEINLQPETRWKES